MKANDFPFLGTAQDGIGQISLEKMLMENGLVQLLSALYSTGLGEAAKIPGVSKKTFEGIRTTIDATVAGVAPKLVTGAQNLAINGMDVAQKIVALPERVIRGAKARFTTLDS